MNKDLAEAATRVLQYPSKPLKRRHGPHGLQQLLGFPDDLPDLQRKRPPGKNRRPEGISTSCFERQRRAELPFVY